MTVPELLGIIGSLLCLMLGVISWFLKRIVGQYDRAQESNTSQFEQLIKRFDVLTEIIYEHKTDVEVIKEQVKVHNRGFADMNILYDRVRKVETDVEVIKARTGQ